MSRVITDLPNDIDPVELIEKKMFTCPVCGENAFDDNRFCYPDNKRMDANGKEHKILKNKNKYWWNRYKALKCTKCGCKWDTGWYPADHDMFKIIVEGDITMVQDAVNKMLKNLGLNLKISTLSYEDLVELEDRFGPYVRFVVEDMLSGKDERFETATYTTTAKL